MPTLREVQRALRDSLLEGEDDAAARFIRTDGIDAAARLAIYRDTFIATAEKALRLSYPAVERLVGAEFFAGAARLFLAEEPPRSADLDAYGAGFADFLSRLPQARSFAYLPDVARLERAVSRALHAPDAPALDRKRLAALASADHARLCLRPAPSLGLLRADHPVDAIWRAVLAEDDAALALIDLAAGPVFLAVQLRPGGVAVERLAEEEWRFLDALTDGESLGHALAVAAPRDPAAALARHLADARFVDFALAAAPAA